MRLVVLMLLLALLSTPAWSATYYIANGGNDGGPCSEAQPCGSIAHGVSRLQAGDTLYLRGGSYGELIHRRMNLPSGGGEESRITIAGAPGETVYLTAGIDLFVDYNVSPTIAYLTFDNFKLEGGVTFSTLGPGVSYIRYSNIERWNYYPTGSGIGLGYGAHHIEYINIHAHHLGYHRGDPNDANPGKPGGHCMYLCGKNLVVRDSHIHHCGNYGLQVYDSGNIGCSDDSLIDNNDIHDNEGDGATTINYGSRTRITRNRVHNNSGDGIAVTYGHPDGVVICGNSITSNTGTGISIGAGVTNTILRNNTLSGNSRDIDDRGTGTKTDTGGGGECPAAPPAGPPPAPKPKPVVTNLREMR